MDNNNVNDVNNNVDSNVQTETEFMLTTIDNPFDYFDDFRNWLMFDVQSGQTNNRPFCCEFLARVAELSDDMTQKERNVEIERAIDEIILNDFRDIYKKVSKTTEIIEPMMV